MRQVKIRDWELRKSLFLVSAKHFYVSEIPRAARTYLRTYALTSTRFTLNFKIVVSHTRLGFPYATNTRCLCVHQFLRCRTAGFVQLMFVLMDV